MMQGKDIHIEGEIEIQKENRTLKEGWNLEHSYSTLPKSFYSLASLSPVSSPKLVVLNHPLAKSLGLNDKALEGKVGAEVFAGNSIPEGALPLAQAYAGHQFGHFTMLGDGRAMLIGEQITPKSERFDIQLKGSGRTPYSRGGDGRATLGPMLREYLISEAMYALGIPTTRSLAVVTTGESIVREKILPGAIVARVAASHLRVGTFQYVATWGSEEELRILADYTLERHYPEVKDAPNPYQALLQEVIKRQAALIAKWQLVGFIHGVMNTDNMTISGETIDYGPCAFMDTYDPATVFSSIDRQGRYAYGNQPNIGGWNLARLAETLLPLLNDKEEKAVELAQGALDDFAKIYQESYLQGMRGKLGLYHEEPGDQKLVESLLNLMHKYQADYTNTFRALTFPELKDRQLKGMQLFASIEFVDWHKKWQARLERQDEGEAFSRDLMKRSNPALIPRNHRVEEALDAAVKEGDLTVMDRFLKALANPYAHSPEQEEYALPPEPSATPYCTFCGT